MTTHAFRLAIAAIRNSAALRSGSKGSLMQSRVAVVSALLAVSVGTLLGLVPSQASSQPELRSTIAFVSTRDNPNGILGTATREDIANAAEIYLMDPATNPDAQHPRRLTENVWGDGFPALSPDGKRIVFDSNRSRAAGEPSNTSDLFVMKNDGKEQTHLTRGSSASWSPDSRKIAFHASASGTELPIKVDPGAATKDGDIFVVNVGDLVDHVAQQPTNITNNAQAVDDDPDWSPDGQKIVFTSHLVGDDPLNSTSTEIYVLRVNSDGIPVQDGMPNPQRLTFNSEEERAPAWSPDGTRIVYMCRAGGSDFEMCVMNADGTGQTALTNNTEADLAATWSPMVRSSFSTELWLADSRSS